MNAAFPSNEELDARSNSVQLIAGTRSNRDSVIATVGICTDDGHLVRVDITSTSSHSAFQDVHCLNGIVYIGHGDFLYVTHPIESNIENLFKMA